MKNNPKLTKTVIIKKSHNGSDIKAVGVKVNGASTPVNAQWSKAF